MSYNLAKLSELIDGHWNANQIDLIRGQVAPDASPDELALFLQVASSRGLDPFARQIHAVHRWDARVGRKKMAIQVGIDGYRVLAERTGEYAGNEDAVFFESPDGTHPVKATVTVWRLIHGNRVPFTASARWAEYAQRKKDGELSAMWKRMPWVMLGKCFDSQTEVLTDKGFRRFAEVSSARVLQVTERGLEPVGSVPFVRQFAGRMVEHHGKGLNFSVTPNHDMLLDNGSKIEAGDLFVAARTRPLHWIPKVVNHQVEGLSKANSDLVIAAAFLADGSASSGRAFRVSVSRDYKVDILDKLGRHESRHVRRCAGDRAIGASGRAITTAQDQIIFAYALADIEWLATPSKHIDTDQILRMCREEARMLIDALVVFDGNVSATGTRRLYTSRAQHREAFEMLAVVAGFSVSTSWRTSDLSDKPNWCLTLSTRERSAVRRWGRDYNDRSNGNALGRTGIELGAEGLHEVWCVTVPSGAIVVRRHGHSMLCGNCAESLALRKGFPGALGGLYTDAEMSQADVIDVIPTVPSRLPSPKVTDIRGDIAPLAGTPGCRESAVDPPIFQFAERGPEVTGKLKVYDSGGVLANSQGVEMIDKPAEKLF